MFLQRAFRRAWSVMLAVAPVAGVSAQAIQDMQPISGGGAGQPAAVQTAPQGGQSPQDLGLVSRPPTEAELIAGLREYPTEVVRALVAVLEQPAILNQVAANPELLARPEQIQPAPSAQLQQQLRALAGIPDVVAVAQAHPDTRAAFLSAYRRSPSAVESRAAQLRIAYRAARLEGLIAWQRALESDRRALEQYRDLVTRFCNEQQKDFPGFPVVAVTDERYYLACPPNEMLFGFLDKNPPPAELDAVLVRYFTEFSPDALDAKALQESVDPARLPQVPSDLLAGQSPQQRANMWKREATGGVGLVPIIWQPEADQPREARLAMAVVEHDRLWSPVWTDPNPPAADDGAIAGDWDGDDVPYEPLEPLPPTQVAQAPAARTQTMQPMQPVGTPAPATAYPPTTTYPPPDAYPPADDEIVVRQGVYGDPVQTDVTYIDQQPLVTETYVTQGYPYAGTTIVNNYNYDDDWGFGSFALGGFGWWGGGWAWTNPYCYRPVVVYPWYGRYDGSRWWGGWGGLSFYYFDNDWYRSRWGWGGWGGGWRNWGWRGGWNRPYYGSFGRFYGNLWSPRYGVFSYGRAFGRSDRYIGNSWSSGIRYRGGGFRARPSFVNSSAFTSFRSRGYRGLDRTFRNTTVRSTDRGFRSGTTNRTGRIGGDYFGRSGARGLRGTDGSRNLLNNRSGIRDTARTIDRSGIGSIRRAEASRRTGDGFRGNVTPRTNADGRNQISPRTGAGDSRGFRDRLNASRANDADARRTINRGNAGANDGRRVINPGTQRGDRQGIRPSTTPRSGDASNNATPRTLRRSNDASGATPRVNRGSDATTPRVNRNNAATPPANRGSDAFRGLRNRDGVGSGSPARDNRRSSIRPSGTPTGRSNLNRDSSTPPVRREGTGGRTRQAPSQRPRVDASPWGGNSTRQTSPSGSEYTVRRGNDAFGSRSAMQGSNSAARSGIRPGGSSSFNSNRSLPANRSAPRTFAAPRSSGSSSGIFGNRSGGSRGGAFRSGGGSSAGRSSFSPGRSGGFSGGNRSFSGGSRSFSGGSRSSGGMSGGRSGGISGGGRGFRPR
jgi:hypothetical protein